MKKHFLILLVLLGLVLGCSREIPDPVKPIDITVPVPPTPTGLSATVGDSSARISWSIDGDSSLYTYRIYSARLDSSEISYSMLIETDQTYYSAANLHNGSRYFFKVSAVDSTDFEGYKSDSISVVPNHYGIVINDGGDYTATRNVTLHISAPLNTTLMIISEDSTFAAAQWENFESTRPITLSPSDGAKHVYCRFRDSDDWSTTAAHSDDIILDTRAVLDSVRFSPAGSPFTYGDIVSFSAFAGETDGEATLTVGSNIISIPLFDDGTRGDAVAGDGIYQSDYTIGADLDFENQRVTCGFTDRAGNVAVEINAGNTMSVRRAPDPVTIYNISAPQGYYDRLTINWNESDASDFAQYRLYRSPSAGVDSTDFLVTEITSRGVSTVSDDNLPENTQYFYRIYVVDNTGLWTGSAEASQSTGQDIPPEPVILYDPIATPGYHDRLELSWSASGENDLMRYELFRSADAVIDTTDNLVYSSPNQTSYTDNDLSADSTYYFGVRVMDRGGNGAWSNTVYGHTNPDLPPTAVDLFPVVVQPDYYRDLELNWSVSDEEDFGSYRLYRWPEITGRTDSTLVALIADRNTNSFSDNPPFDVVADTINYWYVLHLYDAGGNITPSDSIRVHLIDLDPATVSGSVESSANSLLITWDPSQIPDFGSYRLLRDIDADPVGALTVYTSSDQQGITYDDVDAVGGQVYFYWLDIYDSRGNTSRSVLGSGSW